MLSLTIFLPVVGLLLCWALPAKHARAINVVTNVAVLVLVLMVWGGM